MWCCSNDAIRAGTWSITQLKVQHSRKDMQSGVHTSTLMALMLQGYSCQQAPH